MDRREPIAVGQVGPHLLVELVVVEQAVQLDEHRVGLVGQLGHPREDIFGVVAVDEHGEASLSPMALSSSKSFYHLPRASIRSNPGLRGSKSHR